VFVYSLLHVVFVLLLCVPQVSVISLVLEVCFTTHLEPTAAMAHTVHLQWLLLAMSLSQCVFINSASLTLHTVFCRHHCYSCCLVTLYIRDVNETQESPVSIFFLDPGTSENRD